MKKLILPFASIASLWVLTWGIGHAANILAAVTVTASTSGSITSTQLARSSGNSTTGLCSAGASCVTATSAAGCSNTAANQNHTWNVGSFAVSAGTNIYYLNIENTTTAGSSLNTLLCGTASSPGACNVCICIGDTTTSKDGTACTVSGGSIQPTCDGIGHVTSVTSNLTLTCP